MTNKKIYAHLGLLFDDALLLLKFPSLLFNKLGELSATQVAEYLIDHCDVGAEVAYDFAIDWIDSDQKYKNYDSTN